MADALPQGRQVALVAQADLVALHEPHVCGDRGRRGVGGGRGAPGPAHQGATRGETRAVATMVHK